MSENTDTLVEDWTESDSFDAVDSAPVETSKPAAEPPATAKTSPRKKAPSGPITDRSMRHHVRGAISRTIAVAEADGSVRELLSDLLGCPNATEDITVELMLGKGAGRQAFLDLDEVRAADTEPEAAIAATLIAVDKPSRINELWSLCHSLGLVTVKTPPASPAKAAAALATAIRGINEYQSALVAAALELIEG